MDNLQDIINRYDRLLTAPKDKVGASPRGPSMGTVSDILKSVKGFGDKARVPEIVPWIGGKGLGELFIGQSPEFMDDMSYSPSAGIRGGNAATGGLGTLTLDKRSADLGMTLVDALGLGKLGTRIAGKGLSKLADKSGFDATRRAFMEGRGIGLGKPTNEAAVDAASSVLSPVDEILKTPVSRRNVLKGAAAAGGLAATPALLRNFVKDAEHVVPKAVGHAADNAAVSTFKHKFNSLAEYLDDVSNRGLEDAATHADEINYHMGDRAKEQFIKDNHSQWMQYNFKRDEDLYNTSKSIIKDGIEISPDGMYWTPDGRPLYHNFDNLDHFSPQAKKEMNAYKEYVGNQVRDRKALDYFRDPEYMPYDEWGSHLESSGMDLQDAMEFGIKPPISHERAAAIERNYAEKAKSASPFEEGYHWTPEAYEGWSTGYPDTIPF